MIVPPHAASPVYLQFRFLISGTVLYLPRQVDVADIEQAPVHVIVKCLLAAHQFILIVQVDLVDALPLLYKRHQDLVEPRYLPFR